MRLPDPADSVGGIEPAELPALDGIEMVGEVRERGRRGEVEQR
ncbi:hypothetical protein [Arthrobacter methylotrophus]